MEGRALLIGAPREGEDGGEEVDVERMGQLLSARGFQIVALLGNAASRDGILAGYRQIIERTQSDDAAVIYFSGHGGRAIDAERRGGNHPLRKWFRYIVTTDYAQTTADDFRGISEWELSLLLAQLTARTANVTAIFDCCHAAQMSRSASSTGVSPRALSKPTPIHIAQHYDWVRHNVGNIEDLDTMGNRLAVRLMACGDWQSAYPVRRPDRRLTGALTDSLIATLAEVGSTRTSWRTIGAAVQARVMQKNPAQRPIVEGPIDRCPFLLEEVHGKAIPVQPQDEAIRIELGRLTGVAADDLYGVTAFGAERFDNTTAIVQFRVERVEALHALGRPIRWYRGFMTIPPGAIGWPLEQGIERVPVHAEAPEATRLEIAAAISESSRLRLGTPGEGDGGSVRMIDGVLNLFTGGGQLLRSTSGWSCRAAIRQLDHLAAAQALLTLEGAHGIAEDEIGINWGTIHCGEEISRPAHGAALGKGDRIYIRVHNRASRQRFVHVFNIGLRGAISRLSGLSREGIVLEPGESEHVVTPETLEDPSAGIGLIWPDDVPTDEPGVDTLMIIVTKQPADLGVLETTAPQTLRRVARSAGSPLQRLLAQLHDGGTRRGVAADADPFCVVRRSFVLHPLAAPMANPGFAIDEDPLAVHAALRPEMWLGGAIWRARPIEIRLHELTCEHATRVDVLVCTRSAEPMGVYRARTIRVGDGEARDEELVWRGPVRDLVDIYVWRAPDQPERIDRDIPSLSELLASIIGRSPLQEAHHALIIEDPTAPWSLAGGASLALARAAAEELQDAVPGTTGLLHTSFASHENYGIGRQPATGRYFEEGVGFWLSIIDLEVDAVAANR